MLQSDTLLFNGIHTQSICNHFQAKNILDNNCNPLAISNVIMRKKNIEVNNTIGFTNGSSPLEIKFLAKTKSSILLYNIQGQCLKKINSLSEKNIFISPESLPSGMYFLQILCSSGETKNVKLIRGN
jgi:Secretion system C-terminal sorting domain